MKTLKCFINCEFKMSNKQYAKEIKQVEKISNNFINEYSNSKTKVEVKVIFDDGTTFEVNNDRKKEAEK